MNELSNPFFLPFKAALAAALAYAAVHSLGVYDTLSAPFVALCCTSPVVTTGVRLGAYQVVASAVGGLAALLVLLLLPRGAAALGVALFITLFAVHRFRLHSVFLVAGFTVIYAYLLPNIEAEFAVEQRMLSVIAGALSAIVVNTVVSARAYRSIFLRRYGLLRRRVAEGLRALETLVEEPDRAFDPVFQLLAPLEADLIDACRESRWRTVPAELPVLQRGVRALGLLAHLGKELGLQRDDASRQAYSEHVGALYRWFETNEHPPHSVPEGHPWSSALERARAVCEEVLRCESELERKPRATASV